MKKNINIAITGGGLVGSLLALYLSKRGHSVSVFERRPDMRKQMVDGGRSINLALSNRGIRALAEVGLIDAVKRIAIPMHGRMIHPIKGAMNFQPYGKEGQYINSISRSDLNILLMDAAENNGVSFHFEHRVADVDLNNTTLSFQHQGEAGTAAFDAIVGADGAFSVVRHAMQFTERFNFSQDYIEHGYKELHIPADENGKFFLEQNALHIWPRESFMLIALPNPDGSFTCTLFFPFEGEHSFNSLSSDQKIETFFQAYFPDALRLMMPRLLDVFRTNPTSSIVTMKCYPWVRNKTLLIGDSAHAIVPFYGQGMNAGFEDCRILHDLLESSNDDWCQSITNFEKLRKVDTDAIATLALNNFIEMRDLVADAKFILRKTIEAKLHDLYPNRWIPLYSMVTFHDNIRYSEALQIGLRQKQIMDEVMNVPNIETTWQHLDFEQLVLQLQAT